jgi:hypothetical protein
MQLGRWEELDMSDRGSLQRAMGLAFAMLLFVACGGESSGERGEIIGITAQTDFAEAQTGEIEHLVYAGTVVVLLPDLGEVIATCTTECLADVGAAPDFDPEPVAGGMVATITINLDEPLEAWVAESGNGEWEVTEIEN